MTIQFLIPALTLLFATPSLAQRTAEVGAVQFQNASQQSIAAQSLLPVDSDVKIGKLANGLTYYIRKNTEPSKRALLNLVVNVGSLMEDNNQLGLAHFTEHMAFNGTRDFPKNELINYLQQAGVKFGADVNASTSFNETIYKLPLPTDDLQVFEKSFSILANWAGLVTFDEDAIDRERGIILEEERSRGKNVAERVKQQALPLLLNDSHYAARLPIGTEQILKTFKPDVIKQFYKDWYRPNLQAVIAVGDFDPVQVEYLIKKNFSKLKNPKNERARVNYSIPPSLSTKVKVITDPEQTSTRFQMIVRHQGTSIKTAEDLRKSIARSLLNRMLGGRVAEWRQQENPPMLIGSIGYGNFLADIDAFTIAVTAKPGQLEQATKQILAINEQAIQFGFTETELQRAKTSLLNTIERQWKEKNKNNSSKYVNEYVAHFLKGTAIPGIDYEYNFIKQNLQYINIAELNALIVALNQTDNRIVIVEAPEKDKDLLPDEPMLLSWINTAGEGITPYQDNIVTTPLLRKIPLGGQVSLKKENPKTGVTELILTNGVKVILKPTPFKNDQIIINGYSYGGTSHAPDSIYSSASVAALFVNRSGIGDLSKGQLNKVLSGRSVNVSSAISEFTESVSGNSSPAELETAMQLIYLLFTQPRKDSIAWSSTISQHQASMANRALNPTQVFQDTVIAVLNNYNPRKTKNGLTDLRDASMDDAYQFYKDRFADASDFTFVLVGALDAAETIPLVEKYLGALPALHRKESYIDAGFRIPSGKIRKIIHKGIEDKSRVQLVYSGNYTYSAEANIQLEALKEVINYRILNRLRAQENGVYTPTVSVAYTNIPKAGYSITISFNCAPDNVRHLIDASIEEITNLKENGPTATELHKFKVAQQRMKEMQIESNVWWVYYLREQYMQRDVPDEELREIQLLDTVTIHSIQSAAKQYTGGENLIEFILMPESVD